MATTTDEIEQTYKRCSMQAIGLATSLLHDEEDARDVVQETFVRLLENGGKIVNTEAFLYRSVRNACINHIGQMTTRERIRRLLPLDDEGLEAFTEERIDAVRSAAATLLSARESEVVHEVFSCGRSYREAAKRLDVSVSSINKHIVNALRKLRKHFNTRQS